MYKLKYLNSYIKNISCIYSLNFKTLLRNCMQLYIRVLQKVQKRKTPITYCIISLIYIYKRMPRGQQTVLIGIIKPRTNKMKKIKIYNSTASYFSE